MIVWGPGCWLGCCFSFSFSCCTDKVDSLCSAISSFFGFTVSEIYVIDSSRDLA